MESLYAQEPYSPRGYTTMDDLFIPEAPFPHSIAYEEYRFEPIVFDEKDELEYGIFIYVEPAYHTGLSTPKQQAQDWLQQVRQKAEGRRRSDRARAGFRQVGAGRGLQAGLRGARF